MVWSTVRGQPCHRSYLGGEQLDRNHPGVPESTDYADVSGSGRQSADRESTHYSMPDEVSRPCGPRGQWYHMLFSLFGTCYSPSEGPSIDTYL